MNSTAERLSVEKIHVWRGDRHLLKGVSFELSSGQLMQVSGPNGSGKTTLLRVVCGLTRPEEGEVRWCGRPIREVQADYHVRLAYASHDPALKGDLTALENLRFAVGLKRRVGLDELDAALERTGVASLADLPVRALSAGQRRRVSIARVLAMNARLWVLDEPFVNLDGAGARMLGGLIGDHVRAGGAALVVAHHDLPIDAGAQRLELDA